MEEHVLANTVQGPWHFSSQPSAELSCNTSISLVTNPQWKNWWSVIAVKILHIDSEDLRCLLLSGMTWPPHLRHSADMELYCHASNHQRVGYLLAAQLPHTKRDAIWVSYQLFAHTGDSGWTLGGKEETPIIHQIKTSNTSVYVMYSINSLTILP